MSDDPRRQELLECHLGGENPRLSAARAIRALADLAEPDLVTPAVIGNLTPFSVVLNRLYGDLCECLRIDHGSTSLPCEINIGTIQKLLGFTREQEGIEDNHLAATADALLELCRAISRVITATVEEGTTWRDQVERLIERIEPWIHADICQNLARPVYLLRGKRARALTIYLLGGGPRPAPLTEDVMESLRRDVEFPGQPVCRLCGSANTATTDHCSYCQDPLPH